jgi:DNA-binding response OmpR family regulator
MSKKSILIVDDEEDISSLVRLILEDAGYECTTASNGLEALTKIQNTVFDLVLLDIMMPVLNGWEVLRELRSKESTIGLKVAILSARAEQTEDSSSPPQYCEYITKPFEPDDLILRIRKIFS